MLTGGALGLACGAALGAAPLRRPRRRADPAPVQGHRPADHAPGRRHGGAGGRLPAAGRHRQRRLRHRLGQLGAARPGQHARPRAARAGRLHRPPEPAPARRLPADRGRHRGARPLRPLPRRPGPRRPGRCPAAPERRGRERWVLSRSANPQPLQGFALRRCPRPGPISTSTSAAPSSASWRHARRVHQGTRRRSSRGRPAPQAREGRPRGAARARDARVPAPDSRGGDARCGAAAPARCLIRQPRPCARPLRPRARRPSATTTGRSPARAGPRAPRGRRPRP